MRKDLNKLLCERERRPAGARHKEYRRKIARVRPLRDPDRAELPRQQGMSWPYGWEGKQFNENLTPLYGAVRKAVGRSWNAFYSDLRRVFDMRSVINQHILQHLEQYCERNVVVRNERLYVNPTTSRTGGWLADDTSTEFYVDPRDGVIKRNRAYTTYRQVNARHAARKAQELAKTWRVLNADNELRKINGTWFHLTVCAVPFGRWIERTHPVTRVVSRVYDGPTVIDALTRKVIRYEAPTVSYYGMSRKGTVQHCPNRYYAMKRTASRKLLKLHGVVK